MRSSGVLVDRGVQHRSPGNARTMPLLCGRGQVNSGRWRRFFFFFGRGQGLCLCHDLR